MAFEPAHAPDVVPGRGLVAEVALIDPGLGVARDGLGDHPEVLHRVAAGRAMTLRAVGRA